MKPKTHARARTITRAEQYEAGLLAPASDRFVPAPIERKIMPIQTPGTGASDLVGGLMLSANTTHATTSWDRAISMLVKTSAVTVFLSILTLAAMYLMGSLAFFLWLLWASTEWVLCFLVLAMLDWREHPSAIRWNFSNRVLDMMEREQEVRLRSQYGEENT